ncbi:type IV toxin-antitoxin system AbiEi family antitoxin domain-containing protein, partial [Mycolicibacter minnesotensis]|uniref:type IV toxin-antitoxin system AbiEi family antitoxin domain-containing protein n=2 Tax=Mycobacteriaceae TaxID=1762 RepID=UPI0021F26760
MFIEEVFASGGGLATRKQLLSVLSHRTLSDYVKAGAIVRVWHGVYTLGQPDIKARLSGLDLMTGKTIVACMSTAAQLYGFDTEQSTRIHVLDPGVRLRPAPNLMVHQRAGAPLRRIDGRLAT